MKRPAQVAAAVFLALLAAFLLWEFRSAGVIFILSLATAAALRPLVDRQVQRGWPRHAAVLLVYALTVALIFAIVWTIAGPVLDDLRLLGDNLALAYEHAWNAWPHGASWQQVVAPWMLPPLKQPVPF